MSTAHMFTEIYRSRIGISAFGSALMHIVVILGVAFTAPKLREVPGLPTLEITLVQTRSNRAPRSPDLLAQANQDGGGNGQRDDVARNPLSIREVAERPRLPVARPRQQSRVAGKPEARELLTSRSRQKIPDRKTRPDKRNRQTEPGAPGLTQANAAEAARLNAEISRFWQEYQNSPRHKYLNARTREYKYAVYMDAWRAKVMRIGNLNYPEAARRRQLTGNLVLDVALNHDGSVHDITIRRPSGHRLLDDAAIRIVELAAPFAPFPADIRADTDILHITRTWKFNDSGLTSEH